MSWDASKSIAHLRHAALSHEDVVAHKVKTGKCAQRTREAIEAGGVTLIRHHSAKNYGSSLVQVGFHTVTGSPQAGDVVIIQPVAGHPHGHMAMYDGKRWISDFVQIDIWPGGAYRTAKPEYKIYRYAIRGGWPNRVQTAQMA